MVKLVVLSMVFAILSCAVFTPASRISRDDFVFYDSSASKVQLIGDWNNWGGLTGATEQIDPSCSIMEKIDGVWVISFPEDLTRGRYRYAFLVNGARLEPDPLNPDRVLFQLNEVSVFLVD